MKSDEREPRARALPLASTVSIHLDHSEAQQQKRRRAHELQVVRVSAMRLAGFAALLLLSYLHNRFALGSFSWDAYIGLSVVLLGWALLGWLLLSLLYGRLGTRLAFTLLFGDIAMFALVIYATGGDKSWLFFILVVRSADMAFLRARQQMVFAHASVLAYVLLLTWLAGVEGRSLAWPAEAVKVAALWLTSLYLASTRRIVEGLRAQATVGGRAVRDLARQLDEARRRSEMLSAAKSRFLASMSHELRTPLHTIIGSAHLVRGTGLTPEQQRYFTAIEVSAQGLEHMVNQILDFAPLDAGKVNLERSTFRLRQALETVEQSLGIHARERGLDLACNVDDDVPNELVGDVGRLRQVLLNLVANGIKFTEHGAVSVHVRVTARRPDGVSLRFAVTDTGTGIRPEDRQLIFEPFAQAPTSAARAQGGTGLGLAIASELVRRLGGKLEVESELGRGSTFHFIIDFTIDFTGSVDRAVPGDPSLRARDASRRLQILVVEDDPLNADVARDVLERRRHAVVVAKTGWEAIELFDRASFDVVLMDVQLPGLDGLATAAAFRERERRGRGRTRIVALTAGATPGDRERCLAAGIDAYLAKPIGPRTLIATIEALPRYDELPFVADLDVDVDARIRLGPLFLTEAPRQIGDVREGIARRDRIAVVSAAHRLKGSIANFNAPAALEAAERLEVMAGSADPAGAEVAWDALAEELEHLTAALTPLLKELKPHH
jgi:signal transduction histidine kinase/DNA-binding response OmpR family regulator